MTNELLKIVVTDNCGTEHIFNNVIGESEIYLDLRPSDSDCNLMVGWIEVVTLEFGKRKLADAEVVSKFYAPRRVDSIYGPY